MITGNTLINMGYKPGSWFKEAIRTANEQNLGEAELDAYLKTVCPPPAINVRPHPIMYHRNIRSETPEEAANVDAVFATMDVVMRTPTIVGGAVMPDACPAGPLGQIPVGGVAVAKNAIHPAMHSADVCCSVMMTNFENIDPAQVLEWAHRTTHFGRGGRAEQDGLFELPKELEERIADNYFLQHPSTIHMAKTHLGTQGDGNHFLFVGRSKATGKTMMVTHHGSRGFGAALYKMGMAYAEKFRRELSPTTPAMNAWIPYNTAEGKLYWEALQIVREWTKLNHTAIHDAVGYRLGGFMPVERFWNEHNFVFKDENDLFYHAKGATPLDDKFVPDSYNGLRIIPLNMAQSVLIVRGATTATNLGFAPHGAGRNVSRSQHKRGKADRTNAEIFAEETKGLDVRFFSGNIDVSELPSAYKNADAVKAQMAEFGLGEIVDEIIPYGCIMAGDWQANASWRKKK